MIKIIHIHSDLKFIDISDIFFNDIFENFIFIIGLKNSYNGKYKNYVTYFSDKNIDLTKIIQFCLTANVVVFYDLDFIKAKIALKLPTNIKTVWRFFGYELYGRNMQRYLSEQSKLFYKKNNPYSIIVFLANVKFFILYQNTQSGFFRKAISRINIFFCLSRYEYDYLNISWGKLPSFLQIPNIFSILGKDIILEKKNNSAVIGHSKTIFNNHLDILKIIETIPHNPNLRFVVPFSYGMEDKYTSQVRQFIIDSKKNIELFENYISIDQYLKKLSEFKCGIFNGYRQSAMWNIFVLLGFGAKIYLNTKNIIFDWFLHLEIKIFSIEDFAYDLQTDNLELTSDEKIYNINKLSELNNYYNQNRFVIEFKELLNK